MGKLHLGFFLSERSVLFPRLVAVFAFARLDRSARRKEDFLLRGGRQGGPCDVNLDDFDTALITQGIRVGLGL